MKFNRKHERFNVYHLKYLQSYYKGKEYKIVDISKNGFSVKGDLRTLSDDNVFRRFTLAIGFIEFEITAELVYFGADMTSFKIKNFHFNEKSTYHKFVEYMQIGFQEDKSSKKPRVEFSDSEWKIKIPRISVICNPDGIKIIKKPLFKEKNLTLLCILGFISGLNRKKYPTEQLSSSLIRSLN